VGKHRNQVGMTNLQWKKV